MKFDATGRELIGIETDWDDIDGIPELIQELAALADPGENRLLVWNDLTNEPEFSNALDLVMTGEWEFQADLLLSGANITHSNDDPLRITIDADADTDEGRWHETIETGLWSHGIRSDDATGGEDWVQVLGFGEEIEQINLQGGILTFNGDEVLAAFNTELTVGAAGPADALPATPTTYVIVTIEGVQYKIALYEV